MRGFLLRGRCLLTLRSQLAKTHHLAKWEGTIPLLGTCMPQEGDGKGRAGVGERSGHGQREVLLFIIKTNTCVRRVSTWYVNYNPCLGERKRDMSPLRCRKSDDNAVFDVARFLVACGCFPLLVSHIYFTACPGRDPGFSWRGLV